MSKAADFDIRNNILVNYFGEDTFVKIPDGVTEIWDLAFSNNEIITEVVMPDTVRSIGKSSFNGCKNLKKIKLSNNLESIGQNSFDTCRGLKFIELPNSVRYIGYGAFSNCSNLKEIKCGSDDIRIGGNIFSQIGDDLPCRGMADPDGFIVFKGVLYQYIGKDTEIIIPDNVETIYYGAFDNEAVCQKITKITIPETVKEIAAFEFDKCINLKEVIMPGDIKAGINAFKANGLYKNGSIIIGSTFCEYGENKTEFAVSDGIISIADGAFQGKDLKKVVLPEGLKRIGNQAFKGCKSLESINIPDSVEEIGDAAFLGCHKLADKDGFICFKNNVFGYEGNSKSIKLPEGTNSISSFAFYGTNIESLVIPGTVEKIGSYAIRNCQSLEKVFIEDGVKEIAECMFYACKKMTEIRLPATLERIGSSAFKGCSSLENIILPDGLKAVERNAFENSGLRSVVIPDSVERIEDCTFDNCKQLETARLPKDLKRIDYRLFAGCTSLSKVNIPESVIEINFSAFEMCNSLTEIKSGIFNSIINDGAFSGSSAFDSEDGFVCFGKVLIRYKGQDGNIKVPDGIEIIGGDSFREGDVYSGKYRRSPIRRYRSEYGNTITDVIIPEGVKVICNSAFENCRTLKSVKLPESLEYIGDRAFLGCAKLKDINIPDGVKYIGSGAFEGCDLMLQNMSGIKLPVSLEQIVYKQFGEFKSIKKLSLPDNIRKIANNAFDGLSGLTETDINDENSSFISEDGVLFSKDKKTLVYYPAGKRANDYVIPDGVTDIAEHAFYENKYLKKITVPDSVKSVGFDAFPKGWTAAVSPYELVFANTNSSESNDPINMPYIPLSAVKDDTVRMRLALAYCSDTRPYFRDYDEVYKKYVSENKKSIIKIAEQLDLSDVKAYFPAPKPKAPKQDKTVKAPVVKKLSESKKIDLLETAVLKGSKEELIDVIEKYNPFSFTAGAFAMAARYRGLEYVKLMEKHRFSFKYKMDPLDKHAIGATTCMGKYLTIFYHYLIPDSMPLDKESSFKRLSLPERIEIVKYCIEKNLGILPGEMLFEALEDGEIEFADALMEMGIDLSKAEVAYYMYKYSDRPNRREALDILTSNERDNYREQFMYSLSRLGNNLLPVLERFDRLASAAGKKIAVSQQMFDMIDWSEESLSFAIERMDLSKLDKTKTLDEIISVDSVQALVAVFNDGWVDDTKTLNKLIDSAQMKKSARTLAWLLDYKNKTVDPVEEAEKEQKKMMRELNEKPDSVSSLKKIWSYIKQDDGTLVITNYKGKETDVTVPAKIGKAAVSAIGEGAFTPSYWCTGRVSDEIMQIRKELSGVEISEGIKSIGRGAFYKCESLKSVFLPQSLQIIEYSAFSGCEKLKSIKLPDSLNTIEDGAFSSSGLKEIIIPGRVKVIGQGCFDYCQKLSKVTVLGDKTEIGANAFKDCDLLADNEGFVIVSGVLNYYKPKWKYNRWSVEVGTERTSAITIPDGVTKITSGVFTESGIYEVHFPETLVEIGDSAFQKCYHIKEIVLPKSLKKIGMLAFAACGAEKVVIPDGVKEIGEKAFVTSGILKEITIPASVKKMGKEPIAYYEHKEWSEGMKVYTPAGSYADNFIRSRYSNVEVINI